MLPKSQRIMRKIRQAAIQEQTQRRHPYYVEETKTSRTELFLRKTVLAALTMLGIGYILINAPVAILIGQSLAAIPIASESNINAIAGRIVFLVGSTILGAIGALSIFGGVKFYEREETKGLVLLGVLLGSLYLLCLGVGAALLLSGANLMTLLLIIAPLLIAGGSASCTSSSVRLRSVGSAVTIVGGLILAYVIFNFRIMDLIFAWGIPFGGPFMSLTVLESAAVIIAPVAACVISFFHGQYDERPLTHAFGLLIAALYGIGAFIGGLMLSLNFWNLIWKSPWVGPFHGISDWTMSTVVFWSASLVLLDIGGILLISSACLGFVYVAQEFSRL